MAFSLELPQDPIQRLLANRLFMAFASIDFAVHKEDPNGHTVGEIIGACYRHPTGHELLQEVGHVTDFSEQADRMYPRIVTTSPHDPNKFEAMVYGPGSVVVRRDSSGRITRVAANLTQMVQRTESFLAVIEDQPYRSAWWVSPHRYIASDD